jgi:hypothetical protein
MELGIAAVTFVSLVVGLAFGLALGLRHAEPKHRNAQLHEGEWTRETVAGGMVLWSRKMAEKPKDCDEGHRVYVCTIFDDMDHVDACACGMTRVGVYGSWS